MNINHNSSVTMKRITSIILAALCLSGCQKTKTHYISPPGMPQNIYQNTDTFLAALLITVPSLEKRFLVQKGSFFFGLFYLPLKKEYVLTVVNGPSKNQRGSSTHWSVVDTQNGKEVYRANGFLMAKYEIHDDEAVRFLFWRTWVSSGTTNQEILGNWMNTTAPENELRIEGGVQSPNREDYTFSAAIDPATGQWNPVISQK